MIIIPGWYRVYTQALLWHDNTGEIKGKKWNDLGNFWQTYLNGSGFE
jgi:hypothetical protein